MRTIEEYWLVCALDAQGHSRAEFAQEVSATYAYLLGL